MVDKDYWQTIDVFSVWQTAFLMCNAEPWDEPISANRMPPAKVEKLRTILLNNVAHFETGELFTSGGWSCKSQRPAQLSGDYFSRSMLLVWAKDYFSMTSLPEFLDNS